MKKTILIILGIIVSIIVCFMIGLQISNIFESNSEENESFQNNNTQTIDANLEEIHTDGDIEATKNNSFLGIIAEIDIAKKQITVENPSHLVVSEIYKTCEWKNDHKVTINGKTYVKVGYAISLNNVSIRESNGEKIEIGASEGLSLGLNGTDLEQEIYDTYDSNILLEEIEEKSK